MVNGGILKKEQHLRFYRKRNYMKIGDLVQWSGYTWCRDADKNDIGIMLKDPVFPRFGSYPKQYCVLTKNGVEEWIDEYNTSVIKVM